MNIEELKNKFYEYVKDYDMNDKGIKLKYNHSLRVMNQSYNIAKSENLNKNDIEIATIVGLLHDYARFPQWEKYKTFSDIQSVDHGDLAIELLFDKKGIEKFTTKVENYDEIYDAIKYHNKLNYIEGLSEHNKLMCKIIRDADKLDIFYIYVYENNFFKEDDEEVSEIVKKDFYNKTLINYKDIKNKSDRVLLELALVYDLNFKYSFEYLKNKKIIEKIYDNLKNKNKYKEYFDFIINYIEERLNELC